MKTFLPKIDMQRRKWRIIDAEGQARGVRVEQEGQVVDIPASVTVDDDIAKVSVVGVGMRGHSGVAARMFEALAVEDINIDMIATSEIKISVAIRRAQAGGAMEVLHDAFKLELSVA